MKYIVFLLMLVGFTGCIDRERATANAYIWVEARGFDRDKVKIDCTDTIGDEQCAVQTSLSDGRILSFKLWCGHGHCVDH